MFAVSYFIIADFWWRGPTKHRTRFGIKLYNFWRRCWTHGCTLFGIKLYYNITDFDEGGQQTVVPDVASNSTTTSKIFGKGAEPTVVPNLASSFITTSLIFDGSGQNTVVPNLVSSSITTSQILRNPYQSQKLREDKRVHQLLQTIERAPHQRFQYRLKQQQHVYYQDLMELVNTPSYLSICINQWLKNLQ